MNTLSLHPDEAVTTISRHIYGHFSEHLGRCIYGGFWNADDTFREDVIEALKEIQIPNLRWPGGCFADEYHWRDGIGPRESRPSMVNTNWGGVTENNHFGTHEFLDLCERLETEAYICGNVGSGTVQELAEWVEYVNFDGISPRADERRANGRETPWNVKYWGVGNESWGCGGNMRPEFYADEFRRYATYCRNYGGNRLYKIACGANVDDYHWTEALLKNTPHHMMQGLSLHYYTTNWNEKGPATGFGEAAWFDTLQRTFKMGELLERHGALMDHYDPQRKIGLIVDEWGTWFDVEPGTNPGFLYQQNTLRDALVAGIHLHLFHSHAERVHMANLAQTINVLQAVLLTDGPTLIKTPTWHVFEMYKGHQDALHIPLHLSCSEYTLEGKTLPALHASASKAADGSVLLTLCNLHPTEAQLLTVNLGTDFASVTGRTLTASTLDAHNTAMSPHTVAPQPLVGAILSSNTLRLEVPAASVTAIILN
ncbi:MAG: alpha-N-arabinofuranosidase [Armatimonadetes bacterium]|nr:alpha-N-arabinofuranosidase [Armatimonadota bacterium]